MTRAGLFPRAAPWPPLGPARGCRQGHICEEIFPAAAGKSTQCLKQPVRRYRFVRIDAIDLDKKAPATGALPPVEIGDPCLGTTCVATIRCTEIERRRQTGARTTLRTPDRRQWSCRQQNRLFKDKQPYRTHCFGTVAIARCKSHPRGAAKEHQQLQKAVSAEVPAWSIAIGCVAQQTQLSQHCSKRTSRLRPPERVIRVKKQGRHLF